MKRLLYLLIIVGVIAAVVIAGYFFRYRPSGETEVAPATGELPQTPTQELEPPPQEIFVPSGGQAGQALLTGSGQAFGVIAQNKTVNFFVDAQNNVILVQPDGQVVEIRSGEASVLSSSLISNLSRAEFSYDGKKILAEFGKRSGPQYSVFDVASKAWSPLGEGLRSATWSPSSYKIAYIKNINGVSAIYTIDVSQKNPKETRIARLHFEDLSLFWLNTNQIILEDGSSALFPGTALLFDIKSLKFTALATEKIGLKTLWDDKAKMGLVFSADLSRKGGALTLVDALGRTLNQLSFLTLPSKCSFNATPAENSTTTQKLLYCAVPRNQNKFGSQMLPDTYLKRGVLTSDDFYRIDAATGNTKKISINASVEIDGSSLKIRNDMLFFINRIDERVYVVKLK